MDQPIPEPPKPDPHLGDQRARAASICRAKGQMEAADLIEAGEADDAPEMRLAAFLLYSPPHP